MLKDVKKFYQEIKSMEEKINLSLLEEFFDSSSPADYAKMLVNTSLDKSKKIVEEIKDRISNLKDRIKEMLKKIFSLHQKIEDRFSFIKLKINEKKDLATMINNERHTLNDVNELVNKIAKQRIGKNNAIKKYNNLVNKADQIAKLRSTESRQKMLEIFNYLREISNEQTEGKGLKILTPNQMLSRLPITLAQLKPRNNSEKLENEIRQLLCSLYRSKKLTKQLHKSLIDII